MAWPLSKMVDFVANNVPVITEMFLDTLQDTINDLFGGLVTVKAMKLDGTGGQATTAPAGSLVVSRSASGTTVPTPAIELGELCRGLVPVGWAVIRGSDGALLRGINVLSSTRGAAGQYTVTFNTAPTNRSSTDVAAFAMPWGQAGDIILNANGFDNGGKQAVRVWARSIAIAPNGPFRFVDADSTFTVIVFAD